ncbi:AAA family ATPase [Desulfobacca acetoxidans]
MIKTLKIKNYLSLRNICLELSLNNAFVGPNNAGKSNIIEVFRFINKIASSGLSAAVNDRGGFAEILWKGLDDGEMSFFIECQVPVGEEATPRTYQYELVLTGSAKTGPGAFSVEKESLKRYEPESNFGSYTLASFMGGRGQGFHPDGTIAFEQKEMTSKSFLEYSVPGWEGMYLKNYVTFWRFYRLIPFAMRQANAISEQFFLNEYGDNLSAWLLTLQTGYREEYRRLEQAVFDNFPEITGVLTPPTQVGTTFIQLQEKYLKRPVNLWKISDGALQLLALLSLIYAPRKLGAPLYCVEEPENHLHPRILEVLMELLKQRQQELGSHAAQLIFTTHSPYIIDRFDIEDLLAVKREKGETFCIRSREKVHLRKILEGKELGLSDLWYSGALGEK